MALLTKLPFISFLLSYSVIFEPEPSGHGLAVMLIAFIPSDVLPTVSPTTWRLRPKLKTREKTLGMKMFIAALFIIALNGDHLQSSVLGGHLSK